MKAVIVGVVAGALGLTACGIDGSTPSVAAAPAVATAAATVADTTTTVGSAPPTSVAMSSPPATSPAQSTPEPVSAPTEPATTLAPPIVVVEVVDGDTLDLSTGERVRIIGIDAPERGDCGFDEAAGALTAMVTDKAVIATAGAVDDVDRYGRSLRYIDVDGVDVGLDLIRQGLAIARYDSRDGYGHHPRQEAYVAADGASSSACVATSPPASTPSSSAYYANCSEARAAGVTPLHEGEPGYRSALDRDKDGVACE